VKGVTAGEALKAAILADDAADVAAVLDRHPELKAHLDDPLPDFDFGATPLLGAVYRNNREMVEVLLHAGADINARSDWWAGSFGVLDHDGDLSGFLIERGAAVDVHAASRLGILHRLDALLAADPGLVHARGGDGQTPLHFAASIAVAEFLLAHGAEIDALDVDHESTPAQYMVRNRQEVARYLVSRGCRTDVLLVSALGDEARVRQHLDSDPSTIRTSVSDDDFPKRNPRSGGTIYNWTLGTGKTGHGVARDFGHPGVLRLLMERTPDELKLALACEFGDEAAVDALLKTDPLLVRRLTPFERRKLPDAARDGNATAVRLMLAAGFPVDARGQHGATPLHWAGFNGDAGMARELLRYAPPLEVHDRDFDGTPLFWAVYGSVHGWRRATGNYAGVVELLLKAGAQLPAKTDVEASEPVRDALQRWRGEAR
jgi:ankyrin repeat protein